MLGQNFTIPYKAHANNSLNFVCMQRCFSNSGASRETCSLEDRTDGRRRVYHGDAIFLALKKLFGEPVAVLPGRAARAQLAVF